MVEPTPQEVIASLQSVIRQLGTELEAAKSCQMEWQPIETAPKDGSFFLATDGEEYSVTYWDQYAVELYDGVGWRDDGDMGWGGMIGVSPTHWMPLPPAPLAGCMHGFTEWPKSCPQCDADSAVKLPGEQS